MQYLSVGWEVRDDLYGSIQSIHSGVKWRLDLVIRHPMLEMTKRQQRRQGRHWHSLYDKALASSSPLCTRDDSILSQVWGRS